MPFAEEPCLYYYFLYLVQEQGKLQLDSIKEAQELWDRLCDIYKIKNDAPKLEMYVPDAYKKSYYDKKLERFYTNQTENKTVIGGQILAHDILVLCFVFNTPVGYITEKPEKDWTKQLSILKFSESLNYAYGTAVVLQTITSDPKKIIEAVKKIDIFNTEKIQSSLLDCGKLWQFGLQNKYLLTLNREHEDLANKFLANIFAYIITIFSKIEEQYLLSVFLKEDLENMKLSLDKLENNIKDILNTTDMNLLGQKIAELQKIIKESTKDAAYLKVCGNNINSNLINLNDVLPDIKILKEDDEIFKNHLRLYGEHVQNIDYWSQYCDNVSSIITKTAENMLSALSERQKEIKTKQEIDTSSVENVINFEWGRCYIVNENNSERGLKLFKHLLKTTNAGLCITRTYPNHFRRDHQLGNATIKWLTNEVDPNIIENHIGPNFRNITDLIVDYLKNSNGKIILFDGLNYLKHFYDFNTLIKYVEHLIDLNAQYDTTLIFPVSYPTFSDEEITQIKSNMIDITNANLIFE